MSNGFGSYESIKIWKDDHIYQFQADTHSLNNFHDTVMRNVFDLSIVQLKRGTPPCRFSWFVMGSGGRFEQGIISDQDHGIIFEAANSETIEYFRALGEQLSYGLYVAGYPYCEGKVMSSNPIWCKPMDTWKNQLLQWMREESWESIRYLQIFYDSRMLMGDESFVRQLKSYIHAYQRENPKLLKRFMENVSHIKNAVGPLGQIIVEEKGLRGGSIDLKYTAFIPYVNAIRLLAIKEGLHETSTLARFKFLIEEKSYGTELLTYRANFLKLLDYRVALYNQVNSYDDTHYLNISKLSRLEKREIRQILKDGKKLHQFVQGIIEKGVK